MKPLQITLALTGASGAVYGLRLGRELLREGATVNFLITSAGFLVLREECGLRWEGDADRVKACLSEHFFGDGSDLKGEGPTSGTVRYYAEDDFRSPLASGSAAADAMVVCPCSMGTLSRIACGNSGNLIERAADVMLKERRPLVLVPRETPLNEIHLENMLKLARTGARIVPPMPAFYHRPETMDDLVDFVVGRILGALGIASTLVPPWGSTPAAGEEPS